METPKSECIKVKSLRKLYPNEDIDLEKWMAKKDRLYVGRRGRIFIKQSDGTNKIFHYPGSKWANPFKVGKDGTIEICIKKFQDHIINSNLVNDLHELKGKTLGCFCDQNNSCHAKTLIEFYNKRYTLDKN